jgi:hypothetical protein
MSKKIKPTGLGDVVKNITETLGIEQCDGCKKRQQQLNNLVPFSSTYVMTDDDRLVLLRLENTTVNSSIDKEFLFDLYNNIFKTNLKSCQCQEKIQEMIKKLLDDNV